MRAFTARSLFPLFAAVFLLGCSGCAGDGKTLSYQVAVKNELDQPITVWLTKSNGAPPERDWLSPEQVATYNNPRGQRIAGVAVPPGKTAETPLQKGKFPQGTAAVLRIYLGQHTLDELLAIGTRSASRVDTELPPGRSDLVVKQQADGKISVEPAGKRL